MRWLLIFLLVMPCALAAELHGTIYTTELDLATDVLVNINSTPHQRILSRDGDYAFSVPPGTYTIVATYADGEINSTSTEEVTIRQDGDFVFDLFLLPDLEFNDEFLNDDLSLDELQDQKTNDVAGVVTRFLIVIAVLAFFLVAWLLVRKRTEPETDGTAEQVLRIIKTHGGRITQKELRKELPDSEAKISLVISELEARGKIEKIKKGRGNILKIR